MKMYQCLHRTDFKYNKNNKLYNVTIYLTNISFHITAAPLGFSSSNHPIVFFSSSASESSVSLSLSSLFAGLLSLTSSLTFFS